MCKHPIRPWSAKILSCTLAFASVVASLILFAPDGSPQNRKAVRGGTAVIAIETDFDSFNELSAADSDALQVIKNMLFMTLVRLDDRLNFVPHLAKSWQFTNSDSTLTFYLRTDVVWTDGVPTTAQDVLFTYEIAVDTEVAYPASGRFDLIDAVTVLNDSAVSFSLKMPYPDVLFDLQIPILPKHLLESIPKSHILESAFNRNPVGNGPFKLVEWRANERITFWANENYALGRPGLDAVVFTVIPDQTIRFASLLTGEVDLVLGPSPEMFEEIESNVEFNAIRYDGLAFTFVGWNNAHKFLTKPIRQAMCYAIDKEEIINTLLRGYAKPDVGPFLSSSWAFDPNLDDFKYNPDKARQILASEGWVDEDGNGILEKGAVELQFSLKTHTGNQIRKDAAIMIQAQLRKIGIKCNLEVVEWNLFIDQVFERGEYDAFVLGWDTDLTVNPTDLWHSKAIANGYNVVGYNNPRVDMLIEKGRNSSSRASAMPLWAEFQQIIVEDAPYTFLFVPDQLAGANSRLKGLKFDVRGFLADVDHWWIPQNLRKKKPVSLTRN